MDNDEKRNDKKRNDEKYSSKKRNGRQSNTQWHPGCVSATELELNDNADALEFYPEYNLSKKPLQIDMLIIKKVKDVDISNEIGHIFKTYNVLEYKNPSAPMTIDDYYKVQGYACIYKSLGETVNKIPANELTVSMIREYKPKALFKILREGGAVITQKYPGIYYINNYSMFATQIIVTGELSPDNHQELRMISNNTDEDDVIRFLKKYENVTEQGILERVDSIIVVSANANKELYGRLNMDLKSVWMNVFKDDFDELVAMRQDEARNEGRNEGMREGHESGLREGRESGMREGIISTLSSLVNDGMLSLEEAARRAGMSEEAFAESMKHA